MMRSNLLKRKTYDVYFSEDGRKDFVVLNADSKASLRKEFGKRYKGWKIKRIKLHDVS